MRDLSAQDVYELVEESFDEIAAHIEAHPQAGKKFSESRATVQEGWVAWTWCFRQLVKLGVNPAEALRIRSRLIEEQHEHGGTYGAIAACLSSQPGPDAR